MTDKSLTFLAEVSQAEASQDETIARAKADAAKRLQQAKELAAAVPGSIAGKARAQAEPLVAKIRQDGDVRLDALEAQYRQADTALHQASHDNRKKASDAAREQFLAALASGGC